MESLEEGQSLLYHGDVYNTEEDFEVKGAYSGGGRMGGGWPSFGGKSGLRGSATDIMIKSGKLMDGVMKVSLCTKQYVAAVVMLCQL